ncbi:MAG: hypothetical protein GXO89_17460, partial [Chlorobi bacterium]|nr:hypothetical protein [Chlorobiota bacterium]
MRILIIFVLIYSLPLSLLCQEEESTGKHEPKTERKSNRKEKRKEFNKHFLLSLAVTSADINSNVRFESPNGLFSTQIDLERHLGLTDKKALASALFIYRITPRSGLFSAYYGLGRDNTVELQNDIIFKGDTIHKGSSVRSYFNTYNFNIGYIFSILTAEKSFLGAYINLYVIDIKTGVESETFNFKKSLEYLAPLPNFGLIAQFSLKDWLSLSGSYGMFFYNSYDF